jgi:hypothetical protein
MVCASWIAIDPSGEVSGGEIHFQWHPTGRFESLSEFGARDAKSPDLMLSLMRSSAAITQPIVANVEPRPSQSPSAQTKETIETGCGLPDSFYRPGESNAERWREKAYCERDPY